MAKQVREKDRRIFDSLAESIGGEKKRDAIKIINSQMGELSETSKKLAKNIQESGKNATAMAEKFSNASQTLKGYSTSSKVAATAMQALKAAAKMAAVSVLSFAAEKAVTWISENMVTTEKLNQKVSELSSSYKTLTGEASQYKEELKTTAEHILALEGKPYLTLMEQEELDRLKEANDLLQRQITLKEQQAELEQMKLEDAASMALTGKTYQSIYPGEYIPETDSFTSVSLNSTEYAAQQMSEADGYRNKILSLQKQQQALGAVTKQNTAQYEQYQKDIDTYSQRLRTSEENIYQTIVDIQKAYQELSKNNPLKGETKTFLESFDSWFAGSDTKKFDGIVNNSAFRSAKKDLETLAQQGKLTAETLGSQKYKELSDALLEVGISSTKAADYLNALYHTSAQNSGESTRLFAQAYGIDLENFTQAEYLKITAKIDAEFERVNVSGESIDTLAKQYGIDLENFKTVEQQKLAILGAVKQKQIGRWQDELHQLIASGDNDPSVQSYIAQLEQKIKTAKADNPDVLASFKNALSFTPKQFTPDVNYIGASGSSNAAENVSNAFEEAYSSIQHLRDKGVISEEEYLDRLSLLNEQYNKDNKDSWQKYDMEIYNGRQNLLQSQLKAQGEAYSKAIDKQIDKLREEQEESDAYYDRRIQAAREQIDALKEQSEEEDRLLAIEKARKQLEQLKSIRNVRVYTQDKGWGWSADENAISDAQGNLQKLQEQYERDQKIKELEKQIQRLEDSKQTSRESIQSQMDDMESLKQKYAESMSHIGESMDEHLAHTQLNFETEKLELEDLKLAWIAYAEEVKRCMEEINSTKSTEEDEYYPSYVSSSYASGTLSAKGGLSLVGEEGPELRVLNKGDGIVPAMRTRNLLDWGNISPTDLFDRMKNYNLYKTVGLMPSIQTNISTAPVVNINGSLNFPNVTNESGFNRFIDELKQYGNRHR